MSDRFFKVFSVVLTGWIVASKEARRGMKRIWNLLLGYPECVLIVVVTVNALGWGIASKVRAQGYSDGKDCDLTSNIVNGICLSNGSISSGPFLWDSSKITISSEPRPSNCPSGTEKVLVPGGVKCARGLVDPE